MLVERAAVALADAARCSGLGLEGLAVRSVVWLAMTHLLRASHRTAPRQSSTGQPHPVKRGATGTGVMTAAGPGADSGMPWLNP